LLTIGRKSKLKGTRMDEDRPDDPALAPDAPRPRRVPPTIDLEASEVTEKTDSTGGASQADHDAGPRHDAKPRFAWLSAAAISPHLIPAATGAVTAALVIAAAWAIGWPGEGTQPIAKAEINAGAIEQLSSRITELEGRATKPSLGTSDPAQSARLDALEKTLAALRSEVAGSRARSEKLASDLDAVKAAPRATTTPTDAPDFTAIEERLAQVERATRAESDRSAQAATKPADDTALRRLVVASMLDISVRQGEPFAEALTAAKALAPDPLVLKPLEDFAAHGVPNPASLSRELLTLVPKLSPPAPENSTTGTGIVDRLKSGAAKLVRIERTDVVGNDRGAIVARVTAAALRNDAVEARRELNSLVPADRAAAQGWLDKANERDAALAASHHFVAEAMAALAKPVP
jgi:hypothetical protein